MLEVGAGLDPLLRGDLRPEAVAADEDRQFPLALAELLDLGLLVGRPARGGGAFDLAPAVVVAETVQGLDRPGQPLQQRQELGPDLMQLLLTGEKVLWEVIGLSHTAMVRLFDFGMRVPSATSGRGSFERVDGMEGSLGVRIDTQGEPWISSLHDP